MKQDPSATTTRGMEERIKEDVFGCRISPDEMLALIEDRRPRRRSGGQSKVVVFKRPGPGARQEPATQTSSSE